MRRTDREVTDIEEIWDVIDNCKICRLGLQDKGRVYIVPMNFGYCHEADELTLYFHGAHTGHKYDVIAQNSEAGFEMDCGHELIAAESACGYGYKFASVVGNGRAEIVTDSGEKKKALSLLMKQQTGKDFSFQDKQAETVTILKVTAHNFTCKKK